MKNEIIKELKRLRKLHINDQFVRNWNQEFYDSCVVQLRTIKQTPSREEFLRLAKALGDFGGYTNPLTKVFGKITYQPRYDVSNLKGAVLKGNKDYVISNNKEMNEAYPKEYIFNTDFTITIEDVTITNSVSVESSHLYDRDYVDLWCKIEFDMVEYTPGTVECMPRTTGRILHKKFKKRISIGRQYLPKTGKLSIKNFDVRIAHSGTTTISVV